MTEKHYVGFEQIAEEDIKAKSVATLRTVPGRGGTYGENGLTAQDLKERFDALPKLAIARLNALLAHLEEYVGETENRLDDIDDTIAENAAEASGKFKEVDAALGKKIDTPKNPGGNKVLVSRPSGAVELWGMSPTPIVGELAMFSSRKTLSTSTATEDNDTVPYKQILGLLTDLKSEIIVLLDNLKGEILGGASGAYDTLLELEKALTDDKSGTSALLAKISAAEKAISAAEEALGGKVDTEDVSVSATPSTIAKRGASGRLAVGRASARDDAVPYYQMREELERYLADGGAIPPDLLDGITNAIKAIDSLTAKVANLEAGLAPDMFIVDDATAYVKDIPTDAKPYAQVLAVGGMTHKVSVLSDENLFVSDALNNEQGGELYWPSGDSVEVRFGQYYHYNEASTSQPTYTFFPNAQVGKTYVFSYKSSHPQEQMLIYGVTAGEPFTMTEEILNGYITFRGQEADENWEYVDGYFYDISLVEVTDVLLDTPVTALDIVGKNLYNGGFGNNACATEENGVLTLTKTAAGDRYAEKWYPPFPIVECTIYANLLTNTASQALNAQIEHENGKYEYRTIAAAGAVGAKIAYHYKVSDGSGIKSIRFYFAYDEISGATIKMTDIMILPTASPTDTTFSPYHKTTFAIPAAVQALDGYGWGVDGAVNGVEWDDNGKSVYVKRVERRVYDGTEAWWGATSDGEYYSAVGVTDAKGTILTVSHNVKSGTPKEVGAPCAYFSKQTMVVFPGDLATTLDEWKAKLAQWAAEGNPLTVYYELAEPIVTDVSAYFTEDNLISVEGGGTITAVNEHNLAAPTTIIYQKRGT